MTAVLDQAHGREWALFNGDSAEVLKGIPSASIGFSVFSPPFGSLYTYSPSERDLGNSREDEFWPHFAFITAELRRVMMPGRLVAVHVAQIPSQLARDGEIGLKDFRGDTIRHFQAQGFVFHREVCIDKDPQAQAIRTHSKALLFVQLEKDRAWCGPALADYILVFRAPGVNAIPIDQDPISRNTWIEWARPIWYGISETDTLNVAEARSSDDERHICPLQLGTIERCIRLWSNPGETVLSPFAGIGSEVYQAVTLGRRGVGIELKPAYFRAAVKNVRAAEAARYAPSLFGDLVGAA